MQVSQEQQNLAPNRLHQVGLYLFDTVQYDAKARQVRDSYSHVGFCDLQRLNDAHPIISDVANIEAVRHQSWETTEAELHFGETGGI